MSGFYAVGYSVDGVARQELPLDSVQVVLNLNAADTCTLRVVVDEHWGAPTNPELLPPPGASNQLLQPWVACVGVFDADTATRLFYGPVTKRRRQARGGASGWSGGVVEVECRSWEFWLDSVYPEFEWHAAGSGHVDDRASTAMRKVLFGAHSWTGGSWQVAGGGSGTEWQRRASVAGRAGAQFGFMPIFSDVMGLAADNPVYLSWDTISPGSEASTSAWRLIEEVLAQGFDFEFTPLFSSGGDVTGGFFDLVRTPDWGSPPVPVVWLVAGGDAAELSFVDRGDLFARVVHVSAGSGETAAWPRWGSAPAVSNPATLLVERKHPFQKNTSNTPVGSAALEARARIIVEGSHPSPREVSDVAAHASYPELRPGDVVSVEVPRGFDPGSEGVGWSVLGRVQSVSWDSGNAGCEITIVEPGAEIQSGAGRVLTPKPVSYPARLVSLEADVTTLMS